MPILNRMHKPTNTNISTRCYAKWYYCVANFINPIKSETI